MPEIRDLPASPEDAASRRLENPRSIRALAHPARLAIINALATGAELTATQCAELTGLSPSATAYHLKFLERYGFVETAPLRRDHRERPWRATERRTQIDLDGSTPAGASAAAAVAAVYFDTTRTIGVEFTEGEHAEPEEWRDAVLSNVDLWLTVEDFHRVAEELASGTRAVPAGRRARATPGGQQAGPGHERGRPAPARPPEAWFTKPLSSPTVVNGPSLTSTHPTTLISGPTNRYPDRAPLRWRAPERAPRWLDDPGAAGRPGVGYSLVDRLGPARLGNTTDGWSGFLLVAAERWFESGRSQCGLWHHYSVDKPDGTE